MVDEQARPTERAGFVSLGAVIGDLLKDHPKRSLILDGFREARRLIETDGVDAARRRLLADDEAIDLVCPRCQGAGWLRLDVEPGHVEFGQMRECPCGLVVRRKAEQLFGRSRIPAEYADLDLTTYPDRRIAADVLDWWHERPQPWLLLAGDLGVGKTGLAIGLVKRAISEGKSALFRPMVDLLSDIRATYRTRDAATPDEAALMTGCKTIELLALDDIGAERMTGWAQERIFEIINYRYNGRLPTIVTSNLGRADMEEHLGDRIFDRVNGMALLYAIEGTNLRRMAR